MTGDPVIRLIRRRQRELADRVETLVAFEATGEVSPGVLDALVDEAGFLQGLGVAMLRRAELRRLRTRLDELTGGQS